MGLCVLYYVEYSLYNVKKVGLFYLGWNYTLKFRLTLPNDKNLDMSKLEAFCTWQNKHGWIVEICFWKGRKHCRKRRKCWLSAFSSFPAMFSCLEAFNRGQNKHDWIVEICFGKDRKNTAGKGENAGYLHFLLFPQCLPKASSRRLLNVRIMWLKVYLFSRIKAIILSVRHRICYHLRRPMKSCYY